MSRCGTCGVPTGAGDRFCEACGRDLRPIPQWLSSTTRGGACAFCGNAEIDQDGYCGRCGRRRVPGRNRVELDLGSIAAVTDRGSHRRRNEDAAGIGRWDRAVAGIVCDGVASTARADDAAHTAVDAGIVTLVRALSDGVPPEAAARSAFRDALAAVAALGRRGAGGRSAPGRGDGGADGGSVPSCTYVSVVVTSGDPDPARGTGNTVTVCWVGDSRAYWVPVQVGAEPICLTVDDSLIGQMTAAGIEIGPDIGPQGAALTRWLGADTPDVEPHVSTVSASGDGRIVLCSDGLSRYLAGPADLVVEDGPPSATARHLAHVALDAGGHDNVTVVVVAVPPATGPQRSAPVRVSDVRGGS